MSQWYIFYSKSIFVFPVLAAALLGFRRLLHFSDSFLCDGIYQGTLKALSELHIKLYVSGLAVYVVKYNIQTPNLQQRKYTAHIHKFCN
jgi:hypothetical protein